MPNVDKLIIANRSAMEAKYGPGTIVSIEVALQSLIAADKARGLATDVLYVDDLAHMALHGGHPVVSPADERGAMAAVDAAFNSLVPDYVMLLDGPDVIPHIKLSQIGALDDDTDIPSDLPYASNAATWSRQASNFLTVTRVVGRLPAAAGERDCAHLIKLIRAAASHTAKPAQEFQQPFVMSADVWRISTQLSVATTFGPGTHVCLSPPDQHPGIDQFVTRRTHFINCHGAPIDWRFYGQRGAQYPVAMESAKIGPLVTPGTVATAECCYGAELFDYLAGGYDQPISMSYLLNGACAFVGSTNIAYGPSDSNGQADLLTQYFMQEILTGKSSGSAFMRARQLFIQSQIMSGATNLKTIAQFVLLGDPSLTPCAVKPPPEAELGFATEGQAKGMAAALSAPNVLAPDQERKLRRQSAHSAGLAIGASATMPGQQIDLPDELKDRLEGLARSRGVEPKVVTLRETIGGALFRRAAKIEEAAREVATVVDREDPSGDRTGPLFRVMIAHIVDGRIAKIEVSESR